MHFRSLFWRAVVRSEDRLGDPAGYIRNQMGDEMSKHKKFFFLTWIGQEVGVIQRAKMSTDKLSSPNSSAQFAKARVRS